MLKVFLVDDHELVRRGVADLLDEEPDLMVIGQASSVSEALARVPAANPDVVVLDLIRISQIGAIQDQRVIEHVSVAFGNLTEFLCEIGHRRHVVSIYFCKIGNELRSIQIS